MHGVEWRRQGEGRRKQQRKEETMEKGRERRHEIKENGEVTIRDYQLEETESRKDAGRTGSTQRDGGHWRSICNALSRPIFELGYR